MGYYVLVRILFMFSKAKMMIFIQFIQLMFKTAKGSLFILKKMLQAKSLKEI